MRVQQFTFNPFQENSALIIAENLDCAIVDPGMYDKSEENRIVQFIETQKLNPVLLLNTHCHIDHIFGNRFSSDKWKLPLQAHVKDLPTLAMGEASAKLYGLSYEVSPEPEKFLEHGQIIQLGDEELEVRFTPGHAPGHVVLICHESKFVVGGDVLFQGSVGRVDLPGGDAAQLDKSIREQLYNLPDEFIVYPGHGPETSIGKEKKENYYVFEGGSRLL